MSIDIDLTIKRKGEIIVPETSGLNWGQRPDRRQSQAYLKVTAEIQRANFFPETGIQFVLVCDDGVELTVRRCQQNGKAIQTTNDNSLLGRYFRERLGLAENETVYIHHLLKYGRTDVTITKKNDYTYLLDFSN